MVILKTRLALQLGVSQTIGYASSYYLPAILAFPISFDLGIRFEFVFLYSAAASVVAGILGPFVGSLIDRYGGRLILPAGSLSFAFGLLLMANATSPISFFLSWLVIGLGAAMGLYDAAFASVVEILGEDGRKTIAAITLMAGFASTIGWPITSAIEQSLSWREAVAFWALINLVICLPIHLMLPGSRKSSRIARREARDPVSNQDDHHLLPRYSVVVAAVLFLLGGSVQVIMGYHLPEVLNAVSGESPLVLAAATLLGPGQVIARLIQVIFPDLFDARRVAILALTLHPISASTLLLGGDGSMFIFAFIHGMGSGFLTVAGGILPLYIFGAKDYGKRQGQIMAASDILLGFAPFAFGLLLIQFGGLSLLATSITSVTALIFLFWLLRIKKRAR